MGGAPLRGLAGGAVGAVGGYESAPENASPWETAARTLGGAAVGGGLASGATPGGLARARRMRELLANPTPELLAEADRLARESTYKGTPGALFGAPKAVGRAVGEQIPSERVKAGLGAFGSFLMPVYNTIARIHERSLESLPGVGLLPLERAGAAPKTSARPMDRRLAQQAVGLAFGASALAYAAEGGIRGPGPANQNEAQAMRDEGYTPNTTNVGGYWVPNSWFGTWGPILNEVGAINDARLYNHGGKSFSELSLQKRGVAFVQNSARAARDYPALDTAATLTKFFTAPDEVLGSFVGEVAAQYVPGPVRTYAEANDPWKRTRTRGADVPLEQMTEETFRQRSGVGRETLPPAQDILGRDIPNPRQGWSVLGPRIGTDKPDPIIDAYRSANLTIGDPPKELTVPNLTNTDFKPELTPEEQQRWNALRGEALVRRVQPLVDSPSFMAAPLETRQKRLEQARTEAAAEAHGRLRGEIGAEEVRRRITERQRRKAS
jgi:hypothetical protein